MRIGELLLEAKVITPNQLLSGLEYARVKATPLGQTLKLLKFLSEEDLQSGIAAQSLIKLGYLSPDKAMEILSRASKMHVSLAEAAIEQNLDSRLQDMILKELEKQGHHTEFRRSWNTAQPNTALTLLIQGDQALSENKCIEAESNYLQARSILEQCYGVSHLEVCVSLHKLANLYLVLQQFDEAEALYLRIAGIKSQSLAPDDVEVAIVLADLADLYALRGLSSKAEELYYTALTIAEKELPASKAEFLGILRKLNALLLKPTRIARQRKRLGELLIEAKVINADQMQTALISSKQTSTPLGRVLINSGLISESLLALALTAQHLIKEDLLSPKIATHVLPIALLEDTPLQVFLEKEGLIPVAATQTSGLKELVLALEELLNLERELGHEHESVAELALKTAYLHTQQHDLPGAETFLKRALSIWARSPEKNSLNIADASFGLAQLYSSYGQTAAAEPLYVRALELRKKELGAGHIKVLECLEALGHLYSDQPEVALRFFQSALFTKEGLLGREHIELVPLLEEIAHCHQSLGQNEHCKLIYSRICSLKETVFGTAQ